MMLPKDVEKYLQTNLPEEQMKATWTHCQTSATAAQNGSETRTSAPSVTPARGGP